MIFKKKKLISDIKDGEVIDDVFFVKFKKPLQPYAKGQFFSLRLEDSSDGIMLKFWGSGSANDTQKLFDSIQANGVVKVKARASSFNDKIELSVNNALDLKMLTVDEFDSKDFKRLSSRDPIVMFNELKALIERVNDSDIKKVLKELFLTETPFARTFKSAPAAVHLHHAWQHGLLEHSLNVANICLKMKSIYPNELNENYLIAGALLHDIGKTREFEEKIINVVSEEGMLIGHTVIGVQILSEIMNKLNTPKSLQFRLVHLILSHHGSLETGAVKVPAFLEAVVLAKVDDLDSRTQLAIEKIQKANTENNTIYDKHLGNFFVK